MGCWRLPRRYLLCKIFSWRLCRDKETNSNALTLLKIKNQNAKIKKFLCESILSVEICVPMFLGKLNLLGQTRRFAPTYDCLDWVKTKPIRDFFIRAYI